MTMLEAPPLRDGARPLPSVEPVPRPATPVRAVESALDRVRRAPTILEAMRLLPDVLAGVETDLAASRDEELLLLPILEAIDDPTETVTALAATHALGRVPGTRAEAALTTLIERGAPGYEQHALWALSGRAVSPPLVAPLARAVARGGLAGTFAQQALAATAVVRPGAVLAALEATLAESDAAATRRYIVETIGLVPGTLATRSLERVAVDAMEHLEVRATAIAAFADRPGDGVPSSFARLAADSGSLAEATRAMRARRQLVRRGAHRGDHGAGLRVAQVHLGPSGGLATLLPYLGKALAGQQRVAETVSIVRAGTAIDRRAAGTRAHRLETVELAEGEGVTFGSGWPSLVTAEREIRCALLAGPLPDLLHVRMADPGSYAAARVARSLGVPLVFTLAPDPHAPVAAAEAAGTLDRRTFASEDGRTALWFRTRLVERLAHEAREIVLFPRAGRVERIEALTGVDLLSGAPRHTIMAEGIDPRRAKRAAVAVTSGGRPSAVISDLERAIECLPAHRHGMPLVVSAGRLVAAKGMAQLVEAFAVDSGLASRANLVIVGGRLAAPSAAEAAELGRIRRLFDRYPGLQERVVLLGERAHEEVAEVLAVAHHGRGTLVAPRGSYACASPKEEFGLAIIEAMAAGLPVTVPMEGGPATYVEHGRTGAVVDSTDATALACGIRDALDLSASPSTAGQTRAAVEARYTVDRMARSLAAVYRVASGAKALAAPVSKAA